MLDSVDIKYIIYLCNVCKLHHSHFTPASGYINAVAFGTEKYTGIFQYQNIYKTSHNEVILPSKDAPVAATLSVSQTMF